SRRDARVPASASTSVQAIRVRPSAVAWRRCLVVSPMSASDACAGAKRPKRGTKAKRRFSTTKPQARRVMMPATWFRRTAPRPTPIAPQRATPAKVPSRSSVIWFAVERELDAAGREGCVADEKAESFADDAEREPCEQTGGELGGEHAGSFGCEEEGGADGAVAVLAGDEHDPGEGGENAGEAADTEQAALVLGGLELRGLRQQSGEQGEEKDERDHSQHQSECGAGRADLQQLGFDQCGHASASAVSSRRPLRARSPRRPARGSAPGPRRRGHRRVHWSSR